MYNMEQLLFCNDFITTDEESNLLSWILKQPSNNLLQRRTWHYGYEYNYNNTNIKYLGEIPNELQFLCKRLKDKSYFSKIPDQIIINEYKPGQGIAPHIDSFKFGDTIATLSLNSSIIMVFENNEKKFDTLLIPRSLYILKNDIRYKYKHSIPARLSDIINNKRVYRKTRYSITFRTIKGK